MNVKKIAAGVLAVLVVCMLFCGAASAFEVSKAAEINPNGPLVPNETVTGHIQIKLPAGDLTDADKIYFETPLTNATWAISAGYVGGMQFLTDVSPKTDNTGTYITGFEVNYGDSEVLVDVSLKGTVLADSGGLSLKVMTIKASAHKKTSLDITSSQVQKVYDVDNLATELVQLGNAIQTLQDRINYYTATYEWDMTKAQNALEQTRTKLRQAESMTNPKDAYVTLDTADNLLHQAQMEVTLASLSLSLTNNTYASGIIDQMKAKGWDSDALLLEQKLQNLQAGYNQYYAMYMAGNIPDAAGLEKLAADSTSLSAEAMVYEEKLANPFGGFLSVLPIILICLGGAAVIAAVVFVIIKKRKNSWDELG